MALRMLIVSAVAAVFASAGAAEAQPRVPVRPYAAFENVWDSAFSTDGRRLATGCESRGRAAICVFDLEAGEMTAVIPAPEGGRIQHFFWTGAHQLIYLVLGMDRVNWGEGLKPMPIQRPVYYDARTGEQRLFMENVRDLGGGFTVASPLLDDPDHVAIILTYGISSAPLPGSRLNTLPDFGTEIRRIELGSGGQGRREISRLDSVVDILLDAYGEPIAEVRYDREGRYALRIVENGERRTILEGRHEDGRLFMWGRIAGENALAISIQEDSWRRLRIDMATGEMTPLDQTATPMTDPLTNEVVGYITARGGLPEQTFVDPQLAELHGQLKGVLAPARVTLASWSLDRAMALVAARATGEPTQYYLMDVEARELSVFDVQAEPPVTPERRLIRYAARDGLEIEAWVTTPPHGEGPFPAIIIPHTGPRAVFQGGYDPHAAFFAANGYLVLSPNVRGSGGRGEAFEVAGHGEFGGAMVTDLIDGFGALVDRGLARPDGYCVFGTGWGGYAGLMAAIKDPARVGCVATYGAPTDPVSVFNSDDVFLGGGTGYWRAFLAEALENRDAAAAIAPRRRAGEVGAQLLMFHGEDDMAVPASQMRLMRNERRGGARYELIEDEGRDMSHRETKVRVLSESLALFDDHHPAR